MITRAGGATLLSAGALALAGRLLGLVELHVLAGAGVLAVAVAAVQVAWASRVPIVVQRVVRPGRVHVGDVAQVELSVAAQGLRPSPVVTLADRIGDRRGARLKVPPLAPGTGTRIAYRLPTRRRGEVLIGPLVVELVDPLGLVRWHRTGAGQARLMTLPRAERVPALPQSRGTETGLGHGSHPGAGLSSEEFHALRPYVVGDDPRRLHWPMSARADELVVRVDEETRRGHLTIVLDRAEERSTPESFERMVSAAVTVATAHWRAGDRIRLVDTEGDDTGWVTGPVTFDRLMDALATTTRRPGAASTPALAAAGDRAGTVVVVTGDLPPAALAALAGGDGRGGTTPTTVVRFLTTAGVGRARLAGLTVIDVAGDASFATAWTAAVVARRRRRPPAAARPR